MTQTSTASTHPLLPPPLLQQAEPCPASAKSGACHSSKNTVGLKFDAGAVSWSLLQCCSLLWCKTVIARSQGVCVLSRVLCAKAHRSMFTPSRLNQPASTPDTQRVRSQQYQTPSPQVRMKCTAHAAPDTMRLQAPDPRTAPHTRFSIH